jgi:hypothetical protein
MTQRLTLFAAFSLAAFGMGAAHAQPAYQKGRPYTVMQTGTSYERLQDALFAIGDHPGTVRIAAGIWHDCGVQVEGDVRFEAAIPGKTVLDGRLCEGKGALVLRGRSSVVDGLIFANLRADEGNGAGIRLEKGHLTVTQSWFRDSDEGILANNDPKGVVRLDHVTFTHLGRCDRGLACAHSVYINFYDKVSVSNCRFEAGDGGHYLKVRAGKVDIRDNSFDDTAGRSTNYMIDLPAGATGTIAGNWLIQGRAKENPGTLIAVAAESRDHTSNGLTIENNVARLAPGAKPTSFVGDWSGERIVIGNNQLAPGISRYQRH